MAEAAAAPEPSTTEPDHWDPQHQVGTDALQLWSEVGAGLDKNQTGKWVERLICLTVKCTVIPSSHDETRVCWDMLACHAFLQ